MKKISIVDFSSMTNFNREDNQFCIFKTAHHPVRADAKSPESSHSATHLQGFGLGVWRFQNCFKIIQDTLLNCGIKFKQLTTSCGLKNQSPRFIQFHNAVSFLLGKNPFYQNANMLHKQRLHLHNLLLLPAFPPLLSVFLKVFCQHKRPLLWTISSTFCLLLSSSSTPLALATVGATII